MIRSKLFANFLNINFLQRSRLYNCFTDKDCDSFIEIVGANNVQRTDLESMNQDWLNTHKGRSNVAVFPKSTKEVSRILSICYGRHLPVVIQGGKTSLVAGSVPVNDEIILCMSKMNHIESFNKSMGILTCESGCVLQTLDEYVQERGFIMPLDLGAKGSCQIGGNVATNAAGLRFIKYGSLHANLLGLEVVQADGTITDLMSSMRKDNTGYDLKQLFIGSEGTLGVITKVAILCATKPSSKVVVFLSLDSFESLISVLKEAKVRLGEYMSAFELIDSLSMSAVVDNLKLSKPFDAEFYGLIELSTNKENLLQTQIDEFLDTLLSDGLINNATYSSESKQVNKLWQLRELVPEALTRDGYVYKYDVSVPLEHYYDLVNVVRDKLRHTNALRVCGYGHVGDFNLHLNVTSKKFEKEVFSALEPFVYEWIRDRKGSISAEHGLGLKKKHFIHFSKSNEAIEMMLRLKQLFDPKAILNPGKLLPFDDKQQ